MSKGISSFRKALACSVSAFLPGRLMLKEALAVCALTTVRASTTALVLPCAEIGGTFHYCFCFC